MNKTDLKNYFLALLAIFVVFGMGAFKSQINGDRTFYRFELQEGGKYAYTLDVGKMGAVKYLAQPNVMTLYLRCALPEKLEGLRCEMSGVESFVSQGSKKGVWKELSPTEALRVDSKNNVQLNLELKVPQEDVNRREVGAGKLQFFKNEKPFASMDIKIVNSKY